MDKYSFIFHPKAKKELDKLDSQTKVFVVKSLSEFIDNFSNKYEVELISKGKIKKLKGNWEGFYRLRLRNYRVIYEKYNSKLLIHIVRVAHRKEVY